MKKKNLKTVKRKIMALFLLFTVLVSCILGDAGSVYVKAEEGIPDWVRQLGYYQYVDSYSADSDTLEIGSINLNVAEPEKQMPISNSVSCSGGRGVITSVEWYLGAEKVEAGTIAGYNKVYTVKIGVMPPSAAGHNVCYKSSVACSVGVRRANNYGRNSDGSLTVTQSFTTGKGSVSFGTSDRTVVYDGNPIDIAALGMFSFGKNNGPVSGYEIVNKNGQNEPTTGVGSISGSILTVTKPGRFVIKVTTEETEEYVSGSVTATLMVESKEVSPTTEPIEAPTTEPTEVPKAEPTEAPSAEPTEAPSAEPTEVPNATEEPAETPDATETPTAEPTETPDNTDKPQHSGGLHIPSLSGQISVADDNKWKDFCKQFDFKMLLKDKAKVSIIPTDKVSDVTHIKYYVSEKILSKNDLNELSDEFWKDYEDVFYIEKTGKNIVYAKLSDNIGNSNYISSNGMTIYREAVQKTNSVTYTKASQDDCKVEFELNGNFIRKLKNGSEEVTEGTGYTVSDDGTLMLKRQYLDGLEAGEYKFQVSYGLDNYEYEHDDANLLSDTVFKVNVQNPQVDNGDDNKNDNNNNGNDNNNGDSGDNQIQKFNIEKNEIKLNAGFKVSQIKDKIIISWGRVQGVDGYVIYAQYCEKKYTNKSKNIVENGKAKNLTIKKVNGAKLDLKKNYKIYVYAYKLVDGKKYNIGKTITAHVVGRKNAKWTNVKKIKIVKKAYTLKKGEKVRINAKAVLVDKKKKPLSNKHAKEFRYASDNKKIATVSKTGKIIAKGKGRCVVYVYARNGYAKKINITVKK